MISCRTQVLSEVSRLYLAKTFHKENEDCGEDQAALCRGLVVLICTKTVAHVATTFDRYLIDIL